MLCTTAYAPQELLTGWLATVAENNPMTQVVDAARQGFVGGVTWAGTWPALVVIAALHGRARLRSPCGACAERLTSGRTTRIPDGLPSRPPPPRGADRRAEGAKLARMGGEWSPASPNPSRDSTTRRERDRRMAEIAGSRSGS